MSRINKTRDYTWQKGKGLRKKRSRKKVNSVKEQELQFYTVCLLAIYVFFCYTQETSYLHNLEKEILQLRFCYIFKLEQHFICNIKDLRLFLVLKALFVFF